MSQVNFSLGDFVAWGFCHRGFCHSQFGTRKIWGLLSGGILSQVNFSLGDFVAGGFCHGGFCRQGILSRGILSLGDFVTGDFVMGDFDPIPFCQLRRGNFNLFNFRERGSIARETFIYS